MRVIDYSFNDVLNWKSWRPADAEDFEEWITVTVGDENGGSDYQVHICTPISISRIEDKRGCFLIEMWDGLDSLVRKLDRFIEVHTSDSRLLPDQALARHWLWEYS